MNTALLRETGDSAGVISRPRQAVFCLFVIIACAVVVGVVFAIKSRESSSSTSLTIDNATVYLVESLIVGDFNLSLVPGEISTFDAQLKLLNNTRSTLDVTVMYWNLIANSTTPSGKNFTEEELNEMGAGNGSALYAAFDQAAARGVRIRILQGDLDGPVSPESEALKAKYPNQVFIQTWIADDWYESGIMHQKIWIADVNNIYLGSANMDWLSLTQVKEMGVVLENAPTLAQDLTDYFEAWWRWSSPQFPIAYPEQVETVVVNSSRFQVPLTVPCWSPITVAQAVESCRSPFDSLPISNYNIDQQLQVYMQALPDDPSGVTDAVSRAFVSGAPLEVLAGSAPEFYSEKYYKFGQTWALKPTTQGRTFDEDALVYTILDAQKSVSLSVMDFYPGTLYLGGHGTQPVMWTALTESLLKVATSKAVNVRLLVSYWASTNYHIVPNLKQLQATFNLCKPTCSGNFSILLFVVPGWNETKGINATYPPYSRVNHAKYIVTDRRVNVGTSNMEWSYFYQTAGASFNSDDPRLRNTLQQVFDRDWNSPYVHDLNFPN